MKYIRNSLFLFLLFMCISCISDIFEIKQPIAENDKNLRLSFMCDDIQHYQIGTKTAVDKTSAETQINSICVFFFDASGNPLQLTDAGKADSQFGTLGNATYIEATDKTVIVLSNEYFTSSAENAIIEVVANLDEFDPSKIDNLESLHNYKYIPKSERYRDINALPSGGMPMYGFSNGINLTQDNAEISVKLKALMAKVEFSIGIRAQNADDGNIYPRMYIQEWTIGNRPNGVLLSGSEVTTFGSGNTDIQKIPTVFNKMVEVRQAENYKNEVFYLFENRQAPARTLQEVLGGNTVTDKIQAEAERYKADRASVNAAFVEFQGIYHDASMAQYSAKLKFYLGSDNSENFQVNRNSHYKNTITITGLQSDSANHHVTHVLYDSRVTVTGTEATPYFLSVLREHDIDAHFGVTPIDFYFYSNSEVAAHKLFVEVVEPDDHTWIRMEKVPAKYMSNSTLPDDWLKTHIDAGEGEWLSGHGKRMYFTDDLVTSTLKNSFTSTITSHRDRLYLYIDENISIKDRSAKVNITYSIQRNGSSDWEQVGDIRTIYINQRGLKEVRVLNDAGSGVYQYIYMESIEEYLDNYDPYDMYNTELVYPGLQWGARGHRFSGNVFQRDKWCNVYYNGSEATLNIIEQVGADDRHLTLNQKPGTAAEYCYNKNKRSTNGSVKADLTDGGWFLPGIRQLEGMLRDYQSTEPSFRNQFYWSSAAGKQNQLGSAENPNTARATRWIPEQGIYAESGKTDGSSNYTGPEGTGGCADRNTIIRIRAAYLYNGGERLLK